MSHKIYKYTNTITGMSYIGQTRQSIQKRAGKNMINYKPCKKFWEAIQNYGTDIWHFEILWDGLTLDEANIYEEVEIRDNQTLYPYGYNLYYGVNVYGEKTRETKIKMSESHKHPKRIDIAQFFISLPYWKPLSEKRKLIYAKFPEVNRSTICRWVRQWDAIKKIKQADVYPFFISLPNTMTITEKRNLLYSRYPTVNKGTMQRWIRKWKIR